MKDHLDVDVDAIPCDCAQMAPNFRAEALRRMTRLRHALARAEAAAEWRDAALVAFGETRRAAEAQGYALIADLAGIGVLGARGPDAGARDLCRHVSRALTVALTHCATGVGGQSARALRDRLRAMAPPEPREINIPD